MAITDRETDRGDASDMADLALFDRMARELYVAVVSDVLDALGYRDQVMRVDIRPVLPDPGAVVVGRAATQLIAPQLEAQEEPYEEQIAAIDALRPGDVVVIAAPGFIAAATWGELFSTAAGARGARGTVIDGYHRDTRQLLELGYPVFSTGARPKDIAARGAVVARGKPVRCGGVRVRQGDIVFAEVDGIAVIPQDVAGEAVERAFAKAAAEDRCRDDLRAGALLSEVWETHKVL